MHSNYFGHCILFIWKEANERKGSHNVNINKFGIMMDFKFEIMRT
jgi:hypothetical protein